MLELSGRLECHRGGTGLNIQRDAIACLNSAAVLNVIAGSSFSAASITSANRGGKSERRLLIGVGSTSRTVRHLSPSPKSRGVQPVSREYSDAVSDQTSTSGPASL